MKTPIFLMAMSMLLLVSCHHKDLVYESVEMRETDVKFDWTLAPDASPASMAAYFFNEDGSDCLRFEFSNIEGGEIKLPVGIYDGIALNSDDTDWASFRHTDDIDNFEIYTPEVEKLDGQTLSTRGLPRAGGTESEPMVASPGMVWSTRRDRLELKETDKYKTFVFSPEEAVCHYTVDIYGVSKIGNLVSSAVDATLTGMSGGYLHGKDTPSDTKVTIPFKLIVNRIGKSLHGEFLTFGENPNASYLHKLTAYVILSGGVKRYYVYDVTRQITSAQDPRHVHIVVRGLELPQTEVSGGGFVPDVNDWQTENVDLKM